MGFERIAGVDEAGRGALAGPLVAAAVILPYNEDSSGLEELNDSKLLTPEKRKRLFRFITGYAVSWSFACISPSDIDDGGLQSRNINAIREAVHSLRPQPDLVLVDFYRINDLAIPQWSLVHGDRLSGNIAAASILVKVIRDQLMWYWSINYPQYGFDTNKGYGTEQHLKALMNHGPSPCHRFTFRSVNQMELELWVEDEQ